MKKLIILFGICLIFLYCGQKFNESSAKDIIKNSFDLTEKDSLEILGISMESKDVALVKFKLNDVQISSKMRKYDKGWQLDEIQNDFGMWVPADNITRLFSQAEKQKITMKNIMTIATGLTDYVTDHGVSPNQEGVYDESSEFYKALCPFYLKILLIKDSWGNNFRVYCGTACNGKYGISDCMADEFIIVSYGMDGKKEAWLFDPSDPEAGFFTILSSDDYNKDLIIWNGSWIRGPKTGE